MPVLRGEGGGEGAKHLEEATEEDDGAEVTGVGEAAGEGANKEEEPDLGGSDPGDGRGGHGEELCVIGLEDAEGVDDAPGTRLMGMSVGASSSNPCSVSGDEVYSP